MRTTMVPPEAAPAPGVAGGIGPLGGPPWPMPPPGPPPALLGPPLPSWTALPPGPLRTAMRMSVIFKSDAIEFRLTFCGYASRSAQRPSPAAAAPIPRNLRRPIFIDILLLFATKTDSRLEPVHCIQSYVYELRFPGRCSLAWRSLPAPRQLRRRSCSGGASRYVMFRYYNCAHRWL